MKNIKIKNSLSILIILLLFSNYIFSQKNTGLPLWPIAIEPNNNDNKTQIIDWRQNVPTVSEVSVIQKGKGGSGAAFDECGNLLFYVIHQGGDNDNGLNIYNTQGVALTGEGTTKDGMNATFSDEMVQVVPVPNTNNQWYIIYNKNHKINADLYNYCVSYRSETTDTEGNVISSTSQSEWKCGSKCYYNPGISDMSQSDPIDNGDGKTKTIKYTYYDYIKKNISLTDYYLPTEVLYSKVEYNNDIINYLEKDISIEKCGYCERGKTASKLKKDNNNLYYHSLYLKSRGELTDAFPYTFMDINRNKHFFIKKYNITEYGITLVDINPDDINETDIKINNASSWRMTTCPSNMELNNNEDKLLIENKEERYDKWNKNNPQFFLIEFKNENKYEIKKIFIDDLSLIDEDNTSKLVSELSKDDGKYPYLRDLKNKIKFSEFSPDGKKILIYHGGYPSHTSGACYGTYFGQIDIETNTLRLRFQKPRTREITASLDGINYENMKIIEHWNGKFSNKWNDDDWNNNNFHFISGGQLSFNNIYYLKKYNEPLLYGLKNPNENITTKLPDGNVYKYTVVSEIKFDTWSASDVCVMDQSDLSSLDEFNVNFENDKNINIKGYPNILPEQIGGHDYLKGLPYSTISIISNQSVDLCRTFAVQNDFGIYSDKEIINYKWDLGDGTEITTTEPILEHCYQRYGNYKVNVLVNVSNGCSTYSKDLNVEVVKIQPKGLPCDWCVESFRPKQGEIYVLSGWLKESDNSKTARTYNNAYIELSFYGTDEIIGPIKASGDIIDGWQRIDYTFEIPEGANSFDIHLVNNSSNDAYFDDIRIYPVDGNMVSYVYDPITMLLTAELDNNNYATFYEYDESGALIRVKKETERGIQTVKESRTSIPKKIK